MDDSLLAEFQSTFLLGGDVLIGHGPLPHHTLYKQKGDGFGNQEMRRKKFLKEQRERRRNYADYARRVVEGDLSEEDDEMEEGAFDEVDHKSAEKGAGGGDKEKSVKKRRKKKNPYRDQLMLSEWLVDVPEDFEENWMFVVCPIGKRCLVISCKGTTSAYSRSGQLINNFPSLLPGGCSRTYRLPSRDYCILDCIYHEVTRTFYILDIMCWAGHPVYDSDTEFRTYWKETKLREEGAVVTTYARINPLIFQNLTYLPCTREKLVEVLSGKWPLEVDGVMFIHKGAHYTVGRTPLAGWLKPHMIPEVLNIPVSDEFLSCAPTIPAGKMDISAAQGKRKEKGGQESKDEEMDSCSTPSSTAGGATV